MFDTQTLIIGAGVVGLACAREFARAGHEVLVLEQHSIIGSETSARNSEVIHAGIYYKKDSLKAKLCVEGKQLLYDFCAAYNVPHRRIGKLIVATSEVQEQQLISIRQHAIANGVDDLVELSGIKAKAVEPELHALAALQSPSTGIIDSHAYMLALQGDMEAHGGQIAFNTIAQSWKKLPNGGFEITCEDESQTRITTKNLIVSAGLHASKFLSRNPENQSIKPQKIYFAKGSYFRLNHRAPFSQLIYPVPIQGGLGVHLTLDMGGAARFGPDAVWVDEIDYTVSDNQAEKFYESVRRYWPNLPDNSLEPDYSGIRPKLVQQGEPDADFEIWAEDQHGLAGLVGLLGIESPGLTASLAIAKRIADGLE